MLARLQAVWRELDGDERLAGGAALALLVTLFLPWYEATVVEGTRAATPTFSAFGVFSFVEAAIMLVALGVFALLFARGERRAFHLPGGDGTVIFGAGAWAALLLLWRVFDRPDVDRAVSEGITWGFFFAFLAAASLAAAGWRIRTAGRPEPPLVRHRDRRPPDARPAPDEPTPATEVVPRRRHPPEPHQLTLDDADPADAPTRHATDPADGGPLRRDR